MKLKANTTDKYELTKAHVRVLSTFPDISYILIAITVEPVIRATVLMLNFIDYKL